jgi:hypothetical protein
MNVCSKRAGEVDGWPQVCKFPAVNRGGQVAISTHEGIMKLNI